VTVLIPCRNERAFIADCLASIAATTYPMSHLEVLVIDGMSDDGTREILAAAASGWPFVRVLENPKRIQSAALNLGIAAATGDVIVRMDAHNTYDPAYLPKCVQALQEYGADSVGGIWRIVPRDAGRLAASIVLALSHPFGIGNASYRLVDETAAPRWVDTVPYFCCRREVFERLGPFNERVGPGEDMEFNLRLRRAGFRILLVPGIVSTYYARSGYAAFLRHTWRNGVWAIVPFAHSERMPVAWRHLVPLAFVLSVAASAAAAGPWRPAAAMLAAILFAYGAATAAATVHVAWRARRPLYLLTMPVAFASLHFTYGIASVWGGILAGSALLRSALAPASGAGRLQGP
jgi:succinoglycan biosynthesis protein ExoA